MSEKCQRRPYPGASAVGNRQLTVGENSTGTSRAQAATAGFVMADGSMPVTAPRGAPGIAAATNPPQTLRVWDWIGHRRLPLPVRKELRPQPPRFASPHAVLYGQVDRDEHPEGWGYDLLEL